MPTLKEIANRIGNRFKQRSRLQSRASMFVKLGLITVGAAVATITQSIDLAKANHELSGVTIAGIAATALVAIGGFFVYLTEQDISETLEDARHALEQARQFEQEKTDFEANTAWLSNEVTRGLELYNSMDVMRGAIEQSLDLPDVSVTGIVHTCLTAAKNSLLVAFDFSIGDTWTICIYMAKRDKESGKVVLHCVAHDRSIQCDLADARVWQEGIGAVGIAFSTGNEIVIPDMTAPELGTTFNLKGNSRDHDRQRYRSMIAVPIVVGSDTIPWGVAVATSNRAGHFYVEHQDGVSTSEPIRAVAAMTALAVKALANREKPAVSSAAAAPSKEASVL
jgi:hypothetical protein